MNAEKRQEIERKVVRHLIRTMKEKGWSILWVHDSEKRNEVQTETEAMDHVFGADESIICFEKVIGERKIKRSAYIVLGNNGYDCIADHSLSCPEIPEDDFEWVMCQEVQNYADKFCE